MARHLFRVLDERHHLSKPAPPPPPETPTEKLLGCFDGFLRDTKGLRPTTRARLLRERMRRYAVYSEDQSVVSDTTAMVPFAFDQTHSLNLVAGYQFPLGWKVSANFHLNSGRPESGEFSSRTQRVVTDPATGSRAWSPVPLGEVERLPAFARVDARVSKTFTFEEATLELYLDVFSVSFSSEVYGYSYGFDDQLAPLRSPFAAPVVLPTLGVKVVY